MIPKEKEEKDLRCANCGASNVKLYQYNLCKFCLSDYFKKIKVMILRPSRIRGYV